MMSGNKVKWIAGIVVVSVLIGTAVLIVIAIKQIEEPAITCSRISEMPEIRMPIHSDGEYAVTARGCPPGTYYLVSSLGREKMARMNLSTAITALPLNHRLVFLIHGYRTLEKDAVEQYLAVASVFQQRNFPGTLVAYDWTSIAGFWDQSAITMALFFGLGDNSGIGEPGRWEIRGYLIDRNNAETVGGPSLVKFISDIREFSPSTEVDVICFSMGCYVLENALRLWGKRIPDNVGNLVFLAADIDRETFLEITQPTTLEQRVAVYFSRYDGVLSRLSRIANFPRNRLGVKGPPGPIPLYVRAYDQTDALADPGKKTDMSVHSRYLDPDYPVINSVIDFLIKAP